MQLQAALLLRMRLAYPDRKKGIYCSDANTSKVSLVISSPDQMSIDNCITEHLTLLREQDFLNPYLTPDNALPLVVRYTIHSNRYTRRN